MTHADRRSLICELDFPTQSMSGRPEASRPEGFGVWGGKVGVDCIGNVPTLERYEWNEMGEIGMEREGSERR